MDGFTIASGLTTCVLIYAIFKIVLGKRRHSHFYKHASKFPGPPTLPFIGNAHLLSGSTEDVFDRFTQFSKLYPAPYRLWIGNHLAIFINSPEHLKAVLLSPKTFDRGPFFEFARPWLGVGLLTGPAATWRVHRKVIQPSFSFTVLKSFVDIFSARSATVAKEMGRNLDGPEFEILSYTSQYALHTICETTLGVDLNAQTNDKGCYAQTLKELVAGLCKRMLSPLLHPNIIFERTQLGRDQKKQISFMHAFTNDVIQTKKKELLDHSHRPDFNETEKDTGNGIPPRRKVLLDHLIEMSDGSESLSDKELREEVNTIIAAGSDTTAVISSYVMLMLASHPEIQAKACQELWEIYEDTEGEELNFTPENLTRMAYMECVIKETMRIFPIAPILIRSVAEDLNIGEHTFPEGSMVFLSVIDVHRNDVYWPNPMKFDPDRFLAKEVENRAYTYLPFSGGPKVCIGSKYAMMSIKILLATILSKYVLKKDAVIPVEDLRFRWEFVLRPVVPISLRIESRTRRVAPAQRSHSFSIQ